MSAETPWLPEPTAESAPFFDGAKSGRLRLQRCDACGAWHYPVKALCQKCGSTELSWRDASGHGTLLSHAKLHRAHHPRHADRLPIVLAWVDLDEGVRVPTNLVDVGATRLKAGQRVEVRFETLADGSGAVPVFAVADASS